jgi:hypothetical protein
LATILSQDEQEQKGTFVMVSAATVGNEQGGK